MKKTTISTLLIALVSLSCNRPKEEIMPIRKDVVETIFASGKLKAKHSFQVVAQTDGFLEAVYFAEDDLIEKGQLLARIKNLQNGVDIQSAEALYAIAQRNLMTNAPALAQAKLDLAKLEEKLAFDRNNLERHRKLLAANSIAKITYEKVALELQRSEKDYEIALEHYNILEQQAQQELIKTKAQKNTTQLVSSYNRVRALYSGKVYQKYKALGDFVNRGEVIATLGSRDEIYAELSIDESSIQEVKLGQEVVIQLNTNKDRTYQGQVAKILPSFNEENQSFLCEVRFLDTLDFRITHTQLQANIIIGQTENALLIPRNFLQYGEQVQVKGEEGPTKVETKFVSNEWVQVLSGIDDQTILVTDKTIP